MIKTQVLSASDPLAIAYAAKLIQSGDIVAIPTETVYGLAGDATNADAVGRIFAVKGRAGDNPLIVHISQLDMWRPLVSGLPDEALRLAEAFWPGPLTVILPKSSAVCPAATAGLDSVAVRMPAHAGALAVIEAAGLPLAAPSANLSGAPSPTCAAHCIADLSGKIPLILDGGCCTVGIESTVLSLCGKPTVLRPGAITGLQLSNVLGVPVGLASAVNAPLAEGESPLSPGMKYRHYAPAARLVLLKGPLPLFLKELERAQSGTMGLVFEGEENTAAKPCVSFGFAHDSSSQAQALFAALRRLDEMGAKQIYARCPDDDEDSLGVYNRLLRAAAFEVIQL
jgi:L-threonylcarbamoyladenylate synthase